MFANLPPHVLGGAENQSARLAEAWAAAGASVTVAGHRLPTGDLALGRQRIRTRRVRAVLRWGRALRAATYFLSVAWLCLSLRRRVDVIYSRGLGDAAVSIAMLKSLGLCRLPVLACPINARGAGDIAFLKSIPGWRWIARRIDRHVDAINLINSLVEDELRSVGILSPRLSRIPNGIELHPPVVRQPAQARRLVWTGRLERQKGLDLLFAALARLPDDVPDWRLDLYGEGPLEAELSEQARVLGLHGRIAFREEFRLEAFANAWLMPMPSFFPPAMRECRIPRWRQWRLVFPFSARVVAVSMHSLAKWPAGCASRDRWIH